MVNGTERPLLTLFLLVRELLVKGIFGQIDIEDLLRENFLFSDKILLNTKRLSALLKLTTDEVDSLLQTLIFVLEDVVSDL